MKLHEAKQATGLQFTIDGNGPYNVMSSKGDIHDTYDTRKEAIRVATQLNKKHKIDEDHPMTRMMMKAMGDKDPDKTLASNRKAEKKKKDDKKKKKLSEGEKKKKQLTKDEANKTDTCRACGASGVVYNTGLCGDCAKDTYDDR